MTRSARIQLAIVTAMAVLGTVLGWRALWFLTDDAYIAFRYVSNAQLGHGFTWNPPPFLPVEGYTSFLWVWLLDLTWSVTGVQPPRSANLLALACSLGTVGLCATALRRMWLRARTPLPLGLVAGLGLALLVSHQSFLTWSSSGLETALFDLLVLAWVLGVPAVAARRAWLPAVATAAALLELCRPDGLLYAGATLLIPALLWLRTRSGPRALARDLAGLLPLLAIPAHLLWRHGFYGEWLPNTYYAKVVAAWPEAGWRYLLSFVLEHALWLWVPLLLAVPLRRLWAGTERNERADRPAGLAWLWGLALGSVVAHVGYYVLVVGGDHFEYRVLAHTLPLLALGFAWALLRLQLRVPAALALGALFLVAGNLLPWSLWWHSRGFVTRGQTHMLVMPLAPRLPGPLAAYARPWDGLQRWLVDRYVCIRRQEHMVFQQFQASYLPTRPEGGLAFEGVDNPVITSPTVGVLGWVYPHAAVIDILGLNDWVVARTPMTHDRGRVMAHDREPPPGYLGELRAVLYTREGKLHPADRSEPLSDEQIRNIEARWRAEVRP
jgi:arabinofuranosyltransferase